MSDVWKEKHPLAEWLSQENVRPVAGKIPLAVQRVPASVDNETCDRCGAQVRGSRCLNCGYCAKCGD